MYLLYRVALPTQCAINCCISAAPVASGVAVCSLLAPNCFPWRVIDLPCLHRFGHQLHTSLIKDWEWHYIDYDRLKDILKSTKTGWSDDDEQRFVKELEGELDKVFTFQKVKSQEIVQRIKAAEVEVNQVVSK